MRSITLRSSPPVADEAEAYEQAQKAARPRWKSAYKGPDPDRQKIDGKMVVSREELESFRAQYGADKTLRDLLNVDRTGKLPPPVSRSSGRGTAEGRKAEDRDVYRATPKMERELAEMKRPGRDAIEPVLGPEAGMVVLGRTALAGLGRGLAGMLGRRAAPKVADDLVEPVGDLAAQGRVFRSARPDAEAAKQVEYMRRVEERGLKKGGSVKSYAKGGSVRGAGCETRSKKTRYI